MTTNEIIDEFISNVDKNGTYTLDELKKILTDAYKNSKTKKKEGKEKKAPSAYNLFIKDEIAKIKAEDPNVDTKQLMKIAAERWKEQKSTEKSV